MSNTQQIIDTFSVAIEEYKKIFPHSFIKMSAPALQDSTAYITLMLLQPEDCPGGISHNDPMRTILEISSIKDFFVVERVTGGCLSVNPTNPMLAMSSVKCALRKTTGDKDKIIKALIKYFIARKNCIMDNKENIYGVAKIDAKYFQ